MATHDHWLIAEEAVKYVRIFSEIERLSQLKNYYIGTHKVGAMGEVTPTSTPTAG